MKKTKVIFVLLALMLAGSLATAKSNGKSSGKNDDDRPRPGMELTTLTGKLVYAGEEDKAASLQIAEGESLALQLMKKPEGRPDKKDMQEKDFQGKKNEKLDGKNVEVKGFKKRDGSLVVLEVTEQ